MEQHLFELRVTQRTSEELVNKNKSVLCAPPRILNVLCVHNVLTFPRHHSVGTPGRNDLNPQFGS